MKLGPIWFVTGLLFGLALTPLSNEFVYQWKMEPTPAVAPAFLPPAPDLVMGLAELAVDEHRGRIKAESNLDEIRLQAQTIVAKLLAEIERLQKRPTLKKGCLTAGDLKGRV